MMSSELDELFGYYKRMKQAMGSCDVTTPELAQNLMEDSSSLISSFDEQIAKWEQTAALLEQESKAVFARKSSTLSSVAAGDRFARQDSEYNEAVERLCKARETCGYLHAAREYLNRTYFNARTYFLLANKLSPATKENK